MRISTADLIVLGGAAAIEEAAQKAGVTISVPFTAGRMDVTQDSVNVESFSHLEPKADGFRNYFKTAENMRSPTAMLVDKAAQLTLTAPEMTALIGGLRVLGGNVGDNVAGEFTSTKGTLDNQFFVNLLDMGIVWSKADNGLYVGKDRATGKQRWTATPVDLIFGSSSELRALAEVYAFDESKEKFVVDFVAAWHKVMQLDRFDLKHQN